MRPTNVPTWEAQNRRRRSAPLIIVSVVASIVLVSVALTILFGDGGRFALGSHGGASAQSVPPGFTPAPIAHIPSKLPSSYPPIGAPANADPRTPIATPCTVQTPAAASHANVVISTPVVHVGTTATASPTPAATPLKGGLPVCGNGQHPGPRCVVTPTSLFPSTNPTQDQIRQALYNLVTKDGFNNFSMVEAITWQESGWTENIVACDGSGGIGLMQIQPDTATWLNQANGTSYSPYTMDGNIHLGVALLQWEYNYYLPFCNQGLPAGQTCGWDTVWPGGTDGATVRQIVISSYNQGIGTTASYGIQNWQYVNNVMALRQQFLAAES